MSPDSSGMSSDSPEHRLDTQWVFIALTMLDSVRGTEYNKVDCMNTAAWSGDTVTEWPALGDNYLIPFHCSALSLLSRYHRMVPGVERSFQLLLM